MSYNDEWPESDDLGHSSRRRSSKPKFRKPKVLEPEDLTPEEWDEKARTALLNQLTRGPRTKKQLAQMLAKKFVPEEIATALLDRFEEVQLIDDAAYAKAFAHDRRLSRGLSKSALKRELGQAGVAVELIDEALEPIDSEADTELAIQLVRKRWSSVRNLERDARYRRLSGFLGRRGFSGAAISTAINLVEREQPNV